MAEQSQVAAQIPPLMVSRMGKKFRIVYSETRNLARYKNGQPLDGGGFGDEDGTGQVDCTRRLSEVVQDETKRLNVYYAENAGDGEPAPVVDKWADPEGEGIGH